MSEIGGLGQHRTHLEKPRRRVSQNAGVHLPRRTELAGSLHRRVRVDSADGNHERHVLGHGLAEDAANGASKRENRKEKRVKCEERLAGKRVTKLQAKHEEHRNSRGAVEVGKNKQEKASIEGYICVLVKSNTKRCPKVEWRFGSRSSPDKGKPQELFRQGSATLPATNSSEDAHTSSDVHARHKSRLPLPKTEACVEAPSEGI